MSIYLTGVIIAAILCVILHFIEWYEGIDKHLGQEIFTTVFLSMFSWLCAFFAGLGIIIHLLNLLQNIRIKGRTK